MYGVVIIFWYLLSFHFIHLDPFNQRQVMGDAGLEQREDSSRHTQPAKGHRRTQAFHCCYLHRVGQKFQIYS